VTDGGDRSKTNAPADRVVASFAWKKFPKV